MLDLSLAVVVLGFASYYSNFVITAFQCLLKCYNIHKFQIQCDKEITNHVIKKLEKECSCTDTSLTKGFKKVISGWIWSKNLVGYIGYGESGEMNKLVIITTSSVFEELIKLPEDCLPTFTITKQHENTNENISSFYRYGSYEHFYYSRVLLNLVNMRPTPGQALIVEDISRVFSKKKRCTIFIEGPPCTGKSSVGYILAKTLNCHFCNTFNPTDPGDTINKAIASMQDWLQDEDKPIIISIDEFDILLKNIHDNKIAINHKIPTSVTDKHSWSKFIDNLQFRKNLIMILTSNTSKADIDKLDTSYIRRGRVDLYHKLEIPCILED